MSSAEPASVDEAIYFYERLVKSKMPLGAFVVNRVHRAAPSSLGREEVIARLRSRPELRGYSPDDIVQVASDFDRTHQRVPARWRRSTRAKWRGCGQRAAGKAPVVTVPFFDQDIYDVSGLSQMVRYLTNATQ